MIEVSSYQATDLPCSPPVVAVTSLHPDHLDWHGGVQNYYRDKLSVCSQPGADLTVANGDSDLLHGQAALLGPRVEWVHAADDPDATWMEPLGLLGGHNRRNALIARRCLQALGIAAASSDAALRAAACGFRHLDHRLQVTGEVAGVTFVDDSLSTNVLPTLAALDAFPGRRVALIAGGHDRGIDYAPLAAGLLGRTAPTLVLTLPDSGPRIRAEIESAVRAAGSPGGGGPGRGGRGAAPAAPAPSPAPSGLIRSRGSGGLPRPGGGGRPRIRLGPPGRCRAAVARRAEFRPVPGLPGTRRGLHPRDAGLPGRGAHHLASSWPRSYPARDGPAVLAPCGYDMTVRQEMLRNLLHAEFFSGVPGDKVGGPIAFQRGEGSGGGTGGLGSIGSCARGTRVGSAC